MRDLILNFPEQISKALKIDVLNKNSINRSLVFDKIIFCGMGGSALASGIFSDLFLAHKDTHICRHWQLPPNVDNKSLIIIISYSGNTQEMLTIFKEASDKKLSLAILTSGGKLFELANNFKYPIYLIPQKDIPPRLSTGWQLVGLAKILIEFGILSKIILDQFSLLNVSSSKAESVAKKIVKKIKNKIPIIYSFPFLKHLSYLWKTNFNENAKVPAFFNCLPELDHNEIEGYIKYYRKTIIPLFLFINDNKVSENRSLIKIVIEIIKKLGYQVLTIELMGHTLFEKFFYGIILSYWTSYYLALARRVNPLPNENINKIKERISKIFR